MVSEIGSGSNIDLGLCYLLVVSWKNGVEIGIFRGEAFAFAVFGFALGGKGDHLAMVMLHDKTLIGKVETLRG